MLDTEQIKKFLVDIENAEYTHDYEMIMPLCEELMEYLKDKTIIPQETINRIVKIQFNLTRRLMVLYKTSERKHDSAWDLVWDYEKDLREIIEEIKKCQTA